MTIQQTIRKYYGHIERDDNHRYCSWEHCYGFFQRMKSTGIAAERDTAALHLGFYLASWGMYRGSSFLLQRTYTAHRGVIECLTSSALLPLWEKDFGSGEDDSRLIKIIMQAVQAIREAYKPFHDHGASDILVTKVILGALGCLPACDRYFIDGFNQSRNGDLRYSSLNISFIEEVLRFCHANIAALRDEQRWIKDRSGVHYPLMKLIDMHFWQIGNPGRLQTHSRKQSAPRPTVTLSATNGGVQSGTSEKEVKRVYWHGHSGFSVARWCGAQGWLCGETVEVFDRLHIPLGRAAIVGGVYAGKAGKRGQPANLTRDQIAQMDECRNTSVRSA